MSDICFSNENNWFRYRAGAFILKDDKMLFEKSKFGGYYYIIGGGVKLGESSVDCIEREILEETGIDAKVERLAVVVENFFRGTGGIINGLDCHTIEFYYLVRVLDDSNAFSKTDDDEELVWIPVEKIKSFFFKPKFIPEIIEEVINSKTILHIIEDCDK